MGGGHIGLGLSVQCVQCVTLIAPGHEPLEIGS